MLTPQIEAEQLADISESFDIEAVPSFLLLRVSSSLQSPASSLQPPTRGTVPQRHPVRRPVSSPRFPSFPSSAKASSLVMDPLIQLPAPVDQDLDFLCASRANRTWARADSGGTWDGRVGLRVRAEYEASAMPCRGVRIAKRGGKVVKGFKGVKGVKGDGSPWGRAGAETRCVAGLEQLGVLCPSRPVWDRLDGPCLPPAPPFSPPSARQWR